MNFALFGTLNWNTKWPITASDCKKCTILPKTSKRLRDTSLHKKNVEKTKIKKFRETICVAHAKTISDRGTSKKFIIPARWINLTGRADSGHSGLVL